MTDDKHPKRYGMPYKGSKNAIAEWVVDMLPKADTLADLFCGGCAITHCAMERRKYQQYIINDIDARLPVLFEDSIAGKYTTDNQREFITREEFFKRKDSDAYVALVWSFGNNGQDYIYGKELEDYKAAYHAAVFGDNVDELKKFLPKIENPKETDVDGRYRNIKKQIASQINSNDLRSVERLQSLQSLQRLQRLQGDYQAVEVPDGAVIYCDIPYVGTNCGKYGGFDHPRFYEWAKRQQNLFVSEYYMPDDFVLLGEREKTILSSAIGGCNKSIERIYTNRRTWETMTPERREFYENGLAEQVSLF